MSPSATRIIFILHLVFNLVLEFSVRKCFRFYFAYRRAQALPGAWQEITGMSMAGNTVCWKYYIVDVIAGNIITGDFITGCPGLVVLCNTNR